MKLCRSYPTATVCRALNVPRSSVYYRRRERDEKAVKATLLSLAGRWPTYGYRRLTAQLAREGYCVNGKRVRRLMGELGLVHHRRRAPRTTNSDHALHRYPNLIRDLAVTRPDQVWAADITYVRLRNEHVYLAVVMDLFTRNVRGWHLGRTVDAELTITALTRALSRGRPDIHHSDQGVQYADSRYIRLLGEVQISMSRKGEPTENGHVERLMRTIKEEEVRLSDYDTYADARQQIGRFLDEVYQHKRIHSALGYLTPAEFEHTWNEHQMRTDIPNKLIPKCVQI